MTISAEVVIPFYQYAYFCTDVFALRYTHTLIIYRTDVTLKGKAWLISVVLFSHYKKDLVRRSKVCVP